MYETQNSTATQECRYSATQLCSDQETTHDKSVPKNSRGMAVNGGASELAVCGSRGNPPRNDLGAHGCDMPGTKSKHIYNMPDCLKETGEDLDSSNFENARGETVSDCASTGYNRTSANGSRYLMHKGSNGISNHHNTNPNHYGNRSNNTYGRLLYDKMNDDLYQNANLSSAYLPSRNHGHLPVIHIKQVTSLPQPMKDRQKRLRSFDTWPIYMYQIIEPEELADAGFYYIGNSDDIVICAFCDGKLRNFVKGDSAWGEHIRHFPSCPLVIEKIGKQERQPQRQISRRQPTLKNSTETTYFTPSIPMDILPLLQESKETRLETFVNWPPTACVLPLDLAEAGFIYYGQDDVVKCVFCFGMIRRFEPQDTAWGEHEKHFPSCTFVSKHLTAKRSRYQLKPVGVNHKPPMINDLQGAPLQSNQNQPIRLESATPRQQVPVRTQIPFYPEYNTLESRLETFELWQKMDTQDPLELSEAGFFFEGKGDHVRCFHCSGGLCNWEPNDRAWTEHAKWFPDCAFVLQCKGVRFIQMVAAPKTTQVVQNALKNARGNQSPSARLLKYNGEVETTSSKPTRKQTPAARLLTEKLPPAPAWTPVYNVNGTTNHPHYTEEQLPQVRKVKIHVDMSKPYIQSVMSMGYSEKMIRRLIRRQIRKSGKDFEKAETLLDDIFKVEESGENIAKSDSEDESGSVQIPNKMTCGPEKNSQKSANANTKGTGHGRGEVSKITKPDKKQISLEDMRELNRQLKDQDTCKICMDEQIRILILPCAHLVACENCAPLLRECPICRAAIRGTVRINMEL